MFEKLKESKGDQELIDIAFASSEVAVAKLKRLGVDVDHAEDGTLILNGRIRCGLFWGHSDWFTRANMLHLALYGGALFPKASAVESEWKRRGKPQLNQ